MKHYLTLALLACAPFGAGLYAKTSPAPATTTDKKTTGKVDEVESDTAVESARKLYEEAGKALKEAQAARAPSDKIKELTKAKETAATELKEARKDARKRIAEKKADEEKAKRGGKK